MVSRFAKIMPLSACVAARIWRNENDYSKRWRCPEPVYNYEAVLSNLMLPPATVKPKPIPARKSHGQQLAEAKLLQAWFVAMYFWVRWFVLVLGLGCMALGSHSLHLWVPWWPGNGSCATKTSPSKASGSNGSGAQSLRCLPKFCEILSRRWNRELCGQRYSTFCTLASFDRFRVSQCVKDVLSFFA